MALISSLSPEFWCFVIFCLVGACLTAYNEWFAFPFALIFVLWWARFGLLG